MINFPNSYDSLTNPTAWQPRNTPWVEEATIISNINDSVEAIEAYIGTSSEVSLTTLTGKTKQLDLATTKGDILYHDGSSLKRLPRGTDGYMLASDPTDGLKYIAPTSGGTVTNVSGVTANGFTATITNPTTTPSIAISTGVTGIVKGNGTSASAAIQGTDYYAPSGTDVSVSDGGTWVSSLTPFAPIFGGTSGTNPVQQVSVGTTGQVLTSNWPGALPTMQSLPDQYLLLSSLTVSGLASTLSTGTLTGYEYYKIVYNFSSSGSSTTVGMQINGDGGSNYQCTNLYNTSVSTSASINAILISNPSSGFESAGEIIVKAKWSQKLVYAQWSAINGFSLLQWLHLYSPDATSFQFFRWTGSSTINGTIKIYGKN